MRPAAVEPIAIIGMACRFPGAPSLADFWAALCEGRDGIGSAPAQRWNAQSLFDEDAKAPGKINTRLGGFIEDIDRFDAAFFGISPREATQMDPQQRILLELAYEAIEDAGIAPATLAGSDTSVYVGAMTNDYLRHQLLDAYRRIDVHTGSGSGLCMLANRLSYQFDLHGASVAVDSACSSSLVAVFYACQSLWTGQSRLALAAGVNVMLDPAFNVFYTKAGLSARDGRCKTFSAAADGIGRSEGAGVVVLKPLRDALADKDPIYAVIRGGAVNHDGRSNGLTQPNRWAQEQLLRRAFKAAAIDQGQLDYIELHGTGTLIGDPIEANALAAVLAEGGERSGACLVGSVKSNIGHLEAAAGVAGLIKLALSVSHGEIPPSLWFDAPNPHIAFDQMPIRVNTHRVPWHGRGGRRLGGVSSFGLGGTNAHLVVESAPCVQDEAKCLPTITDHWLFLSARSETALRALAARYIEFLANTSEAELPAVCSTALRRKGVHDFRLSVMGRDKAALIERLHAFIDGADDRGTVYGRFRPSHRRLVLVAAGHRRIDTQRLSHWMAAAPIAYAAWDTCRVMFRDYGKVTLPAPEALSLHPLVDETNPDFRAWHFAGQYALLKQMTGSVRTAEVIVADGLGQLAALCAAGALSLGEAVRWLDAGLSREFAEGTLASAPHYSVTCEFPAGRNPSLTAVNWGNASRPWHARIDQAVDRANADVVLLNLDALDALVDPMAPSLASGADPLFTLEGADNHVHLLFARLALRHKLEWGACVNDDGFVRLPSYPWQREVFWLPREAGGDSASAAVAPPVSNADSISGDRGTAGDAGYALLGRRAETPALCWESRLSANLFPYLADHRVQGLIVLPGAAYAELGLAVHREVSGQGACVLENLKFHKALVIEPNHEALLRTAYDKEAREYAIYSQRSTAAAWELHARGKLSPVSPAPVQRMNLGEVQARCTQSIDAAAHYRNMHDRGLAYGPYFQGVRRLWRGPEADEALAWIEGHAQLAAGEHRHRLHSSVFDACLQTLLAALGAQADAQLYVPVRIRQLTLHGVPKNGFWCLSKLTQKTEGLLEGDVTLFDEQGEVLVQAQGVRAQALTAKHEEDVLKPIDEWLYAFAWEKAARARAPGAPGDWLVFMDRGHVGERLKERLAAAGAGRIIEVLPAETFGQLSPTTFLMGPDRKADLQSVLQHAAGVEGIVYLWGLDMPNGEDGLVGTSSRTTTAVHLIQALMCESNAPQLVIVTCGAQSVLPKEPLESVMQAPLLGLARVAVNEHAGLRLRAVDVDRNIDTLAQLADEILSDSRDDETALRGAERYVPRLLRRHARALDATATLRPAGASGLFKPDGTYLITGGFGGFGLEIAAWMVAQGARNLVLAGRRGAPTPEARQAVEKLQQRGARVLSVAADVSQEADVERLLARIAEEMPPLKGVFHTAAILEDGPVREIERTQMEHVLRPKALGAWYLHRHTQGIDLDHFVLFSSIASIVGSPGQASYAMACAYLDALAHYRRALNLPATSINWGALGQVGMVARHSEVQKYFGRIGVGAFTPAQAVALLDRVLRWNPIELGVAMMDWRLCAQAYPTLAASPKYAALIAGGEDIPAPSANEALKTLSELAPEARQDAVADVLARLLAETLEMAPEKVDRSQSLLNMGIDSLMAMELQAAVEKTLGVKISTLELMKGNSLTQLAQHLVLTLSATPASTASDVGGARPRVLRGEALDLDDAEKIMEIVANLDGLSDEEVDRLIGTLAPQEEIGT